MKRILLSLVSLFCVFFTLSAQTGVTPTITGDTLYCNAVAGITPLVTLTGAGDGTTAGDGFKWFFNGAEITVTEDVLPNNSSLMHINVPTGTHEYALVTYATAVDLAAGANPSDTAKYTVVVNAAHLDVIPPLAAVICAGESADFEAGGATSSYYVWYAAGPTAVDTTFQVGEDDSFNTGPLTTTTPFMVAGYNAAGCENTSPRTSVLVTVIAHTDVITVDPVATTICPGDSTDITPTATMPATTQFFWYTQATGGIAVDTTTSGMPVFNTGPLSASAAFYVEGATAEGCVTPFRTSSIIAVSPNNDVITTTPAFPMACPGDSVDVIANSTSGATDTFFWYNTATGGSPIDTTYNQANIANGDEAFNSGTFSGTKTVYVEGVNAGGCVTPARTPVVITSQPYEDVITISNSPSVVCAGDSVQFEATSVSGNSVTFYWYTAATGGTPFDTTYSTGDDDTVNTGPLAANTTFYVSGENADGCETTLRVPAIATLGPNADVVTVDPVLATLCPGDSAQFVASSTSGSSTRFYWFTAATGGSPIDTTYSTGDDDSFNTGGITTNTLFYVEGATDTDCRTAARTAVTVAVQPNADVITVDPATTTVCAGDSADFTAASTTGASTTFYWYTVAANGVPIDTTYSTGDDDTFNTGAIAGPTMNYYVEGETAEGCRTLARTTVPVVVGPNADVVTVTPPAGTICSGDSAQFEAASTLGSSTIFYWYTTATGGVPIDTTFSTGDDDTFNTGALTATTNYFVEGSTDEGCLTATRTLVAVVVQPNLDVVTVDPATGATCAGDSLDFTAASTTGGSTIFYWYTAATGGSPIDTTYATGDDDSFNTGGLTATTTFFVEGTTDAGCATAVRTPVPVVVQPNADVVTVNPVAGTICPGDSLDLTASSTTTLSTQFIWYDAITAGTALDTTDAGTPFNTGPIAGTTTFFVAGVTDEGCETPVRTAVPVAGLPNVDVVVVTPPTAAICSGDSLTLSAVSTLGTSTSFRWYLTATGGTALDTTDNYETGPLAGTTTFHVSGVSDAGCETALRTPVPIVAAPNADVITVDPVAATICAGDSAQFEAASTLGSSEIFYWYTALTGGSPIDTTYATGMDSLFNTGGVSATTIFYVEGNTSGGCATAQRTPVSVVVQPNIDVVLVDPTPALVCEGDSVTLNASSTLGTSSDFYWYDAVIGGTRLDTTSAFNTGAVTANTTFFVTGVSPEGCETAPRLPVAVVVQPNLDVITVDPLAATICAGDSADFEASSTLGSSDRFYWYEGPLGGSPIDTTYVVGADDTFNTGAVTATRNFYVAGVSPEGCITPVRAIVPIVIQPNLDVVLVDPLAATICAGDSAQFTASSTLGTSATFRWYAAPVGGSALDTTTDVESFNTGALTATTNFHVSGVSAEGCETLLRTPVPVVVAPNLDVVIVDPLVATICSGDSAQFTASSTLGTSSSFYWYESLTGGTAIDTTSGVEEFNSGPLTANKTYYVEGVSDEGCVTPIRVLAPVVIQPNVDIILVDPLAATLCSGDSVELTASSTLGTSTSFRWYTTAIGGTAEDTTLVAEAFNTGAVAATTTFHVEGVSDEGCVTVLRTPVVVAVVPNLDVVLATPAAATICPGDSAQFTASSTLGTSSDFYWYTAAVGGSPVDTTTGAEEFNTGAIAATTSYFVSGVSSEGCETIQRTPVPVVIQPNLDVITVDPAAATICSGDSVLFDANSTLGNSDTFYWYDALTGGTLLDTSDNTTPFNTGAVTSTTTFYVTGISDDGCETPVRTPALVAVVPNVDVVTLDPLAATICAGDSVDFDPNSTLGTSSSFYWYTALVGGSPIDTTTTGVFNTGPVNATTTFYVSGVSDEGCETINRTPAAVVVVPNLDVVTVTPPLAAICAGDSVDLLPSSTLGSSSSFYWYTALTGGSPIDTTTGLETFNTGPVTTTTTFYVSGITADGCETPIRTPVVISVVPNLDLPIVDPLAATICAGDSVDFSATSALGTSNMFIWYDALVAGNALDTTASAEIFNTGEVSATTTFYVSGVSAEGCETINRTPAAVIIQPNVDVITVNPIAATFCAGDSAQFVASSTLGTSTSFVWYDALTGGNALDTTVAAEAFNTGAVTATTTFYVEGVTDAGCVTPLRTPAAVVIQPNLDVVLVDPLLANLCPGDSADFMASTTLGTSSSFYWYSTITGGSPLDTTYTAGPDNTFNTGEITSTTTFFVSGVSDEGCETIQRTPVAVAVLPNLDLPIVDPLSATICPNDSVDFSATSSLGTSTQFYWYASVTGGTALDTTGIGEDFNTGPLTTASTFFVSGVSAEGCESINRTPAAVIILPNPDVITVDPLTAIICSGDSATFTANSTTGNSSTFVWYDALTGGNALDTTQTFNTGATTATTTFFVSGVTSDGCETPIRTPAPVIIQPNVDVILVDPLAVTICTGDSAQFEASSTLNTSTSFVWYDALVGGNALDTTMATEEFNSGPLTATTTYYVSGVSDEGCETAQRTPAPVVIQPNLDVVTVDPLAATICAGDSAQFEAMSALGTSTSFYWYATITGGAPIDTTYTTGADQEFNSGALTTNTTYFVSGISPDGCETAVRTPAAVIIMPNADVVLVDPLTQTTCAGDSVEFLASSTLGTSSAFYWYNAPTGGIPIDTTDNATPFNTGALGGNTSFYVAGISPDGCETLQRTPAITVILPNADVVLIDPLAATICAGDSAEFTASSTLGTSDRFVWYNAITGGTALDTTIAAEAFNTGAVTTTSTFFVTGLSPDGCETPVRLPAAVVVQPNIDVVTVDPIAATIAPGDSAEFTANSTLGTSTEFYWYADATGGTALDTTTTEPFNTGAVTVNTIFYVEGATSEGCVTAIRTPAPVIVEPNVDVIIVDPITATICAGDSVEFEASSTLGSSTSFRWYTTITGGTAIDTTVAGEKFNTGAISSTTTFFVSGVDDEGRETTLRTPAPVLVVPNLDVVTVDPIVATICAGDSAQFEGMSTTGLSATFRWYNDLIGGTAIDTTGLGEMFNSGALTTNRIYYVSGISDDGCETATRTPATVVIQPNIDVPLTDPLTAAVCTGDSVNFAASSTLGTSTQFYWYDALIGGNRLDTTTTAAMDSFNTGPITGPTTFYVSGVTTEGCETVNRTPVAIILEPNLDVVTVDPIAATVCDGDSTEFTASSTLGSSVEFYWYTSLLNGTPLDTTALTEAFNTGAVTGIGQTFYVSGVDANGCETPLRTPAPVAVVPNPDAITVDPIAATICAGDSVDFTPTSLLGGSTSFYWYNSLLSNTPIDTTMGIEAFNTGPVTSNSTFFVAGVTDEGCITPVRTPAAVVIQPNIDLVLTDPLAATICAGDSVNVAGISTLATSTQFYWYADALGGTPLDTTTAVDSFNTGPLTDNTTFFVAGVTDEGCETINRTPFAILIQPNIDVVTVDPIAGTICAGDSVEFTAMSNLGTSTSFRWYTDLLGGMAVDTTGIAEPFNTGAVTETTTFFVEGVNDDGCATPLRTPVAVAVLPNLDVPLVDPITAVICAGDSAQFTASSPLGQSETFVWYDAIIGGNALDTTTAAEEFNTGALTIATTYFVSGVNASGCETINRTPVPVIVGPNVDVITVDPISDLVCAGDSVDFTANSTLGTSSSFVWYDALLGGNALDTTYAVGPDNTFNSGPITEATTFYVSGVTDEGCETIIRTPAAVLLRPHVDVVTVDPLTALFCTNDSADFVASSATGMSVEFYWYDALVGGNRIDTTGPAEAFNTGPVSTTTAFFVSGVDNEGCETLLRTPAPVVIEPNLDVVLVDPPAATFCGLDSAQFTASSTLGTSTTFIWYDALLGGNALDTTTASEAFNTGPLTSVTTYFVAGVTDEGCETPLRTPVPVIVQPNLDVVTVVAAPQGAICPGEKVVMTATSTTGLSVAFYWYDSTSATTPSFIGNPYVVTPQETTTYAVEGENALGCLTPMRAEITVVVEEADSIASFSYSPNDSVCIGDPVAITANTNSGLGTIRWFTTMFGGLEVFSGPTISIASVLQDTVLFAEVLSLNGCISNRKQASVTADENNDVVTFNPPTQTVCPGETATIMANSAEGNTVFRWYNAPTGGNLIFTGQTFTTPQLSSSVAYYVETENKGGCTSSERFEAVVNVTPNSDIVTFNPANPQVCAGDSIVLMAISQNNSPTIRWYADNGGNNLLFTGASFQTPPLVTTTTYFVQTESGGGCPSQFFPISVDVTQDNDVVTVSPSDTTICSNGDVLLTASSQNNVPNFEWYSEATGGSAIATGSTFNAQNITSDTAFYVQSVNGACVSERAMATIQVEPNDDVVLLSAASDTICSGDSTSIMASSQNGSSTFIWYDEPTGGTSLFTGTPFSTGSLAATITYYVASVNANGCISDRSSITIEVNTAPGLVTVTPPIDSVCFDNEASFMAMSDNGVTSFNWYSAANGGVLLTSGASVTFANIVSDTAFYVAAAPASGCESARFEAKAVLKDNGDSPTISGPIASICGGVSVELMGNSLIDNPIFVWSDMSGTEVFTGNPYQTPILNDTSSFFLYTEDSLGCRSKSVGITINVIDSIAAPSVDGDSLVCEGADISLMAMEPSGSANITWWDALTGGNRIAVGSNLTTVATTTMTFYAQAELGECTSSRTAFEVVVQPVTPLAAPNVSCTSDEQANEIEFTWNSIPGAIRYEVSANDGITWDAPSEGAGATTHIVQSNSNGNVEVTLIVRAISDESNCTPLFGNESTPETCTLDGVVIDFSVFNSFSPNGDGVNDIWGAFRGIEFFPDNTVTIFNRWGMLIYEASGYNTSTVFWDGRDVEEATYYYVIEIPSENRTLKGYVMVIK